jgi:MinD-like ATPase involved in chromosome partitioning or flagellar assembly
MIAIAGSKGGCGKTVTTIGLTEAFARAGMASVAIDADRQLPNLHITAGVDREPTLAALESADRPTASEASTTERTTELQSIAHQSPRASNAGIVPAPMPSERGAIESVLETLDTETVQPFVDCPSGAGPDVVEPLSAADGVIVVTTATERSISAAETTIEMARRLEAPILGAVLNRCETVPEAVDSWIDVPVLGLVPETETPLTDESTQQAYGDIIETLQTRNATNRTPPEYDDALCQTGIATLDHNLGGGLAPGTVVALSAPPASQSEQLLYQMTAPRGTLYLSTERSVANVRRAIASTTVETGTPTIRSVEGKDTLENATELLEKLPDGATLIVDPIAELERHDRSTYVSFLNSLKERMVENESIAVLHCLTAPEPPDNRTATIHAVDAVFDLQPATTDSGTAIEHELSIRKFRADSAGTETVELAFGDSRPMAIEPKPETT